jgi:hypothetical protein
MDAYPTHTIGFDPQGTSAAALLSAREAEIVRVAAEHVASLLSHAPVSSGRRVDAATVADALGVSRDWVYAHASELGGRRIGTGARGRLRFDLDQILAAEHDKSASTEIQPGKTPTPRRSIKNRPARPTMVRCSLYEAPRPSGERPRRARDRPYFYPHSQRLGYPLVSSESAGAPVRRPPAWRREFRPPGARATLPIRRTAFSPDLSHGASNQGGTDMRRSI